MILSFLPAYVLVSQPEVLAEMLLLLSLETVATEVSQHGNGGARREVGLVCGGQGMQAAGCTVLVPSTRVASMVISLWGAMTTGQASRQL